jgi:Secretion system C-terminal sorting domain
MVHWQTLAEINTRSFELQRSIDNRNFTAVGNLVAAAGNSNSLRKYQATDHIGGITGVVYYRVKLTDADGKSRFSNTAIVRVRTMEGITVWPNPFTNSLVISMQNPAPARMLLTVTDVAGKIVLSSAFNVSAGASQFAVDDLDMLANGVYILNLVNEKTGDRIVQKMVKR